MGFHGRTATSGEVFLRKDLKALRAVQRRDYEFVNSHRSCLRRTSVLLRVRAEEHGFIIDVYKAQFSLDKPRRFAIISSELDELYRFKELAVKGLILECAPDGDMPLLFHAACLLPVDTECSLTFKSLCFTDSDITQVLIMLTRIRSIPLLKLKECVFPADSVARFFLSSQVASRSFRIEDDQCFTKGNVRTSNDVGDELLSIFLLSDCDAISLSTVEEVSFRGLVNFIRREINMMDDLALTLSRRRRAAWEPFKSIEYVVKRTKDTRFRAYLFDFTMLPSLSHSSQTWSLCK
ncbi:unnamed protein product [Angiostrongylus costaricensis]|uniref:FBD domain-containing protein n=1 Tax=Angiostrongylus costaricensis TaxID=334426 RepID=A0A158PGG0_ANGCS|nr:unnamed protein product [Angiostrongylus costaricensis]